MRKMNTARSLVCALIALVCGVSAQQPKSDLEKANLTGPVAKVKLESTYFRFERVKFVESERELRETSEYDRQGKLVSQKKIPMFGDPLPCHPQYKYDDKHRETKKFCQEGTQERVLEKYEYE